MGQLLAHFTVTLTVAKSSSAAIMAIIAETSRLWLIVGRHALKQLQTMGCRRTCNRGGVTNTNARHARTRFRGATHEENSLYPVLPPRLQTCFAVDREWHTAATNLAP